MITRQSGKRRFVKFLPAIIAVSVVTLTSCESENPGIDKYFSPAPKGNLADGQFGKSHSSGRFILTFHEIEKPGHLAFNSIKSIFLDNKIGTGNLSLAKIEDNIIAVNLTLQQVQSLTSDKRVALVEEDQAIFLSGTTTISTPVSDAATQTISWGALRVGTADGAATNRTAWIVDSGIQLDHPDLNVDAAASKSFIQKSASPADEYGHGTQVAGILAAKNNSFGVVGVAAGARLVSLRVMDEKGRGSVSAVVSALKHVATYGKPGDVVNLSLGASPSETLDNAAIAVAEKGIFVVIAAGNIADNAANYSPARVNHPNIFTVSAMKTDDTYMGVSNWGTPVDYCAPGSRLTSTRINSSYGNAAGTSMAAPHLSGILLLKGNRIKTQGTVKNDPDGNPDPIPML